MWLDHRETVSTRRVEWRARVSYVHNAEAAETSFRPLRMGPSAPSAPSSKLYLGPVTGSGAAARSPAVSLHAARPRSPQVRLAGASIRPRRHVYPGSLRDRRVHDVEEDGGNTFTSPVRRERVQVGAEQVPGERPSLAVDARRRRVYLVCQRWFGRGPRRIGADAVLRGRHPTGAASRRDSGLPPARSRVIRRSRLLRAVTFLWCGRSLPAADGVRSRGARHGGGQWRRVVHAPDDCRQGVVGLSGGGGDERGAAGGSREPPGDGPSVIRLTRVSRAPPSPDLPRGYFPPSGRHGGDRLLVGAMSPSAPQPTAAPAALYTPEQTAPVLVRLGAWAFRQRSWLPVPLGLSRRGCAPAKCRPGAARGRRGPRGGGRVHAVLGGAHIGTISRTARPRGRVPSSRRGRSVSCATAVSRELDDLDGTGPRIAAPVDAADCVGVCSRCSTARWSSGRSAAALDVRSPA